MRQLKYYNTNARTNTSVSFSVYDKEGALLMNRERNDCFSRITYDFLPARAHHIIFYKKKTEVPYSFEIVQKWIKELFQLGFPCSVTEENNTFYFRFNIDDFTYKTHLNSTLQLVRAIAEDAICYIPEFYFSLIEKSPRINKFLALQSACRTVDRHYNGLGYLNTNHIVTGKHKHVKFNVTKEKLFENFKTDGTTVWGGYPRIRIEDLWKKGLLNP